MRTGWLNGIMSGKNGGQIKKIMLNLKKKYNKNDIPSLFTIVICVLPRKFPKYGEISDIPECSGLGSPNFE